MKARILVRRCPLQSEVGLSCDQAAPTSTSVSKNLLYHWFAVRGWAAACSPRFSWCATRCRWPGVGVAECSQFVVPCRRLAPSRRRRRGTTGCRDCVATCDAVPSPGDRPTPCLCGGPTPCRLYVARVKIECRSYADHRCGVNAADVVSHPLLLFRRAQSDPHDVGLCRINAVDDFPVFALRLFKTADNRSPPRPAQGTLQTAAGPIFRRRLLPKKK